jgi:hypothetical protein
MSKVIQIPYVAAIPLGKKRYTLGANLFYSGTHFAIRTRVVNYAKDLIAKHDNNDHNKLYTAEARILLKTKNMTFDIDNKGYFWCKVFLDYAKGLYLNDDNVRSVPRMIVEHEQCKGGEQESVTFYLNELCI